MSVRIQHLYFIADKRRTAVKIGVATNPSARLWDLQAGNHSPLQLDLVLNFDEPGAALRYEDALHQQFARHWRHREWFTYASEIKDYVAAWNCGEVPPIVWPEMSCAMAVREHGVGLRKEEFLAMLRGQARKTK